MSEPQSLYAFLKHHAIFLFPVSAVSFPKVPGGLRGNLRFFVPGKSFGILAAGHAVETFLKEAFASWDAEIRQDH